MTASADGIFAPAWSIGGWEVVVILVALLVLFGGRKLPELARGLGRGLREFKSEMGGVKREIEDAADSDEDDWTSPPS